jgi:hypothetical protein
MPPGIALGACLLSALLLSASAASASAGVNSWTPAAAPEVAGPVAWLAQATGDPDVLG